MQKLLWAQPRVASSLLTSHWRVQPYSRRFRLLSTMPLPKDDPGNSIVSHASSNVTSKPNSLPGIPSLPPPAQGWPTPWLGRSEIEEYLHPLYKRGWKPSVQESSVKVRRHERSVDCNNLKLVMQGKESTFLSVEYAFKKFDQAIKFVGDVGAIANDEDVRLSLSHHTSFPLTPYILSYALGLCYYILH